MHIKLTLATWKFSGRRVSTISCSGRGCWLTDDRKPSNTRWNVNFFISTLQLYKYPFNYNQTMTITVPRHHITVHNNKIHSLNQSCRESSAAGRKYCSGECWECTGIWKKSTATVTKQQFFYTTFFMIAISFNYVRK